MTTKAKSPTADDLPERFADANAKGYWGEVPDPLPNSTYSMEGGAPTITTAETVAAAEAADATDNADEDNG